MKKQVRILSAVCAAACAVSVLAMPAAASYVETTTEPLAKVIRDLRTREDIFLNEKTSCCEYWNAEQWELITYRRISYPITIKAGTYEYDTVKAKLTELLTCRTPGSFVISDTEKNEYGNTATAYLLTDGDTLTLSIDPTLFSMDESACRHCRASFLFSMIWWAFMKVTYRDLTAVIFRNGQPSMSMYRTAQPCNCPIFRKICVSQQ